MFVWEIIDSLQLTPIQLMSIQSYNGDEKSDFCWSLHLQPAQCPQNHMIKIECFNNWQVFMMVAAS